MKELIKYIVQTMVDNPEQVEVSEVEGNRFSVLLNSALKMVTHSIIKKQGLYMPIFCPLDQ